MANKERTVETRKMKFGTGVDNILYIHIDVLCMYEQLQTWRWYETLRLYPTNLTCFAAQNLYWSEVKRLITMPTVIIILTETHKYGVCFRRVFFIRVLLLTACLALRYTGTPKECVMVYSCYRQIPTAVDHRNLEPGSTTLWRPPADT